MRSNGPIIPELALHIKKRKRRSKSPGLICCCRFVRREAIENNSPIYTARELSIVSLGIQQSFPTIGSSQKRPLTKSNGKDQIRIEMPKFADDTPSNTADYLNCGNVKEVDLIGLETARTSRIEDLKDYQPMEQLVTEILSEDGEALQSNGKGHKMPRICSRRQSAYSEKAQNGVVQWQILATDEFQSPMSKSTIPSNPLCSLSSSPSICPSIITECQLPVVIPPYRPWRLAISSIPQSVCQICWVAYVWMASSLAFLLDRLL